MRILIVTASLPYPLASGGAIRVYGMIKGLHEAGHQITLAALHDGQPAPESTPLAEYCAQIITAPPPQRSKSQRLRDLILTRTPDIAKRLYSDAFAQKLRALLQSERFDIVQCEAIEAACYMPIIRQAQPQAKLVFDTFNAEYMLQRVIFDIDRREPKRLPLAVYSWIQAGRIERYEGAMCRLADGVIAVSPEDADALRALDHSTPIHIMPSGIFVDDYAKESASLDLGRAVIFSGKMDYRPNVDAALWFARDIYPHIKAQVADVRWWIVGQQPHPRLEPLRVDPSITITGRVDAVQPYLTSATVYAAPLRMGSGTRLKLLEAMASGCAIVATSIAASGLLPEVKAAMRIADSETAFAEQVTALLNDPITRATLGAAARQQVAAFYDWSVLIPRLLRVYKGLSIG